MADYWDEFSVGISFETEEEKSWLLSNIEWDPEDPKSDKDFAAAMEAAGEELDGWAPFAHEVVEEDSEKFIHVFTEYGGLSDGLLIFVQHYLKKFRPNDAWAIRWGSVCSKKRLDGFSGGAAFVTAEKIESWTAADFVYEKATKFKGKVTGNV